MKVFGRVVQLHFYGWMKGCGTGRKRASFLVVVRFYSCQRAEADLALVDVGVPGGDFLLMWLDLAVRFSCSIIFSLWKWQVKKKFQWVHSMKKDASEPSQSRNSYASAEVATFLLNESPAESLLILDVGSEGHRGITEEAAEQKKKGKLLDPAEREMRGWGGVILRMGDPTCISVSCSYVQAW